MFVYYRSLQVSLCFEFTGEVSVTDTACYIAFRTLPTRELVLPGFKLDTVYLKFGKVLWHPEA